MFFFFQWWAGELILSITNSSSSSSSSTVFSWQKPESECLCKTCTNNNNGYNNTKTPEFMGPKNWFLSGFLRSGSDCVCMLKVLCLSSPPPSRLWWPANWSVSIRPLSRSSKFAYFKLSLVLPVIFRPVPSQNMSGKKAWGAKWAATFVLLFSSLVYKNIYKIVYIYGSAWRTGVDTLTAASTAPRLTFIWFWKKLCFTCWKLDQL